MANFLTQFTPADFSPIFGPEEKPTRKGWYCSTWGRLKHIHTGAEAPVGVDLDFWWWDGTLWRMYPDDNISCEQNRYWFGLKEKP